MTPRVCPIDGNPLPERKGRGRRLEFCSKVCVERARQRRRKAAKLLEFALHLDDVADEGQRPGRERPERLRERAQRLREDAAVELRGLPL
jgi:hypothetical protein